MSLRIECPHDGYENVWVEFRDDRWPFKDRRAVLGSVSDADTLRVVLGYVTNWHLVDVDGKPVKFELPEPTEEVPDPDPVDLLDNVDDTAIIGWLIGAWFEARVLRSFTSKKTSDS